MSTASGARSRTCSSESHRSASTTIASGSSTDTASISASSVSAAATTSNPLVPSRASMLPTRPAVITRSRSLGGREPAGACAETERCRIDMSVGSRWNVVDDLLYETPCVPSHAPLVMSHDGSTLADTTRHHPAVTRSDYRRVLRHQLMLLSRAFADVVPQAASVPGDCWGTCHVGGSSRRAALGLV